MGAHRATARSRVRSGERLARDGSGEPVFEVIRLFHPSFHVLDLDDAERWYDRVFGLSSTRLSTGPVDPDNRTDYSTFTLIRDVLLDSIDPTRFVKDGLQQYPTVDETQLKALGGGVERR